MLKNVAEIAIRQEFNNWIRVTEIGLESPLLGMFFFNHLSDRRPDLLSFRSRTQKEQLIEGWVSKWLEDFR